jgi:hypothetical protein
LSHTPRAGRRQPIVRVESSRLDPFISDETRLNTAKTLTAGFPHLHFPDFDSDLQVVVVVIMHAMSSQPCHSMVYIDASMGGTDSESSYLSIHSLLQHLYTITTTYTTIQPRITNHLPSSSVFACRILYNTTRSSLITIYSHRPNIIHNGPRSGIRT